MKFTVIIETFASGHTIQADNIQTFRTKRLQHGLATETKEDFRETISRVLQQRATERLLETELNLPSKTLDGLLLICVDEAAARELLTIPLVLSTCCDPLATVELMISENNRLNVCLIIHPHYVLNVKWASQASSMRARRG